MRIQKSSDKSLHDGCLTESSPSTLNSPEKLSGTLKTKSLQSNGTHPAGRWYEREGIQRKRENSRPRHPSAGATCDLRNRRSVLKAGGVNGTYHPWSSRKNPRGIPVYALVFLRYKQPSTSTNQRANPKTNVTEPTAASFRIFRRAAWSATLVLIRNRVRKKTQTIKLPKANLCRDDSPRKWWPHESPNKRERRPKARRTLGVRPSWNEKIVYKTSEVEYSIDSSSTISWTTHT